MRLEVPVVITMTTVQIESFAQDRGLDPADTEEIVEQVITEMGYEAGGQYWTAEPRQQRARWRR